MQSRSFSTYRPTAPHRITTSCSPFATSRSSNFVLMVGPKGVSFFSERTKQKKPQMLNVIFLNCSWPDRIGKVFGGVYKYEENYHDQRWDFITGIL